MNRFLFFCLTFWISPIYAQQFQPTVLLELFSSEGCGSCPQADAFMQEILHLADSTQSPVYVLDYHVDIWNRSGWVDKYSDSITSKKQLDYMEKAGQKALFTPMLFVNGQYGLPAGEKGKVGQAIYAELSTAAPVALSLNANMLNDGKGLNISYQISAKTDSLQLVIVLAEREIISKVTAGENAGKTLVHHNVVRTTKTFPLNNTDLSGIVQLPLNEDTDLSGYILTGYLQHIRSWQVMATDQLGFKK